MYEKEETTSLSHYLRTGQKQTGFRPDSYADHDLCDLCGGTVYDLDIKGIRNERNTRYRKLLQKHETAKQEGKTHKAWQTIGGPRTRQSHRRANGQIVSIDEKFHVGGEELFLPNDPNGSLSETANCRCTVEYLGKTKPDILNDADKRVSRTKPSSPMQIIEERRRLHESNPRKHYSLKDGVILPAAIEQQVSQIADRYYLASGKDIIVTSGRRSYLSQATEMYKNRVRRGFFGNYKAKKVIDLLEDIFIQGTTPTTKKPKAEIVREMEKVISIYAKRGTYISKHIIDGAVDIRSKNMSSQQKEAFRISAAGIASYVKLEGNPKHWHLQF